VSAAKTRVVSTDELRDLAGAAKASGFKTTVSPLLNLDPSGIHILQQVFVAGDVGDEDIEARIRAIVLAKISGKDKAHMCLVEVRMSDWLPLETLDQFEARKDAASMKWLARQ
jgi:hypothetical protein